jgi:formate dehydrogenase subunit delta
MTTSTADQLIYRANQIAAFFATQNKGESAALHVAEHITAYWTPSMRKAFVAYVEAGNGGGLKPIALEAVDIVKNHSSKAVERALARKGEHATGHAPGDDAG